MKDPQVIQDPTEFNVRTAMDIVLTSVRSSHRKNEVNTRNVLLKLVGGGHSSQTSCANVLSSVAKTTVGSFGFNQVLLCTGDSLEPFLTKNRNSSKFVIVDDNNVLTQGQKVFLHKEGFSVFDVYIKAEPTLIRQIANERLVNYSEFKKMDEHSRDLWLRLSTISDGDVRRYHYRKIANCVRFSDKILIMDVKYVPGHLPVLRKRADFGVSQVDSPKVFHTEKSKGKKGGNHGIK